MKEFQDFYESTYQRMFRTLRVLCASTAQAEDAVAEAYTRAFVRWDQVSGMDQPEAWVRRVAMNQAVDEHRVRLRDRRAWPRAHAANPVQAGPEDSRTTDLVAALRSLPPMKRQVLVLFYVADRSVADIARELSLPTGTVKAHLSRGRTQLASLLHSDLEVLHEH